MQTIDIFECMIVFSVVTATTVLFLCYYSLFDDQFNHKHDDFSAVFQMIITSHSSELVSSVVRYIFVSNSLVAQAVTLKSGVKYFPEDVLMFCCVHVLDGRKTDHTGGM